MSEKYLNIVGKGYTILDVRTPLEFEQGHLSGAVNLPLFSNEERVEVGTLYKKVGREQAILRGLELVGPKMANLVTNAKQIAGKNELVVYCWRGGMRSQSVTWLLRTAGLKVRRLEGGYKSARAAIRSSFEQKANIVILGGYTGSGKTDYIRLLQDSGQQVLDLEGAANHKGSAFGHIGEKNQPTNEQFENDLFMRWLDLDLKKSVVIENESVSIGSVRVPDPLFAQMKEAPVIAIEVSRMERVERLVRDYASCDKSELVLSCQKIAKRLGGDRLKLALEAIELNQYDKAADIILDYYDKYYQYGLEKRDKVIYFKLPIEKTLPEKRDLILNEVKKFEEYL